MMISNREVCSPRRRLRVPHAVGLPLLALVALLLVISCSKEKSGESSPAQKSSQKFSGTLPVRIVPEAPTTADDIHAAFVKSSGVSFTWEKNGVILDGVTAPTLPRNNFSKHDSITVIVRKGNEKGSATVVIGNALPKVTSSSFLPVDIHRGVDIVAAPVAIDADGDKIRFEGVWFVNGKELKTNSLVLPGNSFQRGDQISFEVRPFDAEAAGPPYKTKTITIPNAQPYFVSLPPAKLEGSVYSYHASAVDPDGDPLTYSLAVSPQGMLIDAATGVLTWHAPQCDTGAHQVEIVARDPEGAQVSQKYSLHISLNNRNAP